ncbi:hypothetical protein GOP47_0027084 [Adiantum capillus-veneris]|nr:hypothetical protein GOP47_0027084 [Adiantum capillus-veneris]
MEQHDEEQLLGLDDTQVEDSLAGVEDERLDKMHDILIAVLRELVGDDSTGRDSLRSDLLDAVHSLKDNIDNYAVNIADVQVVKLEEQIYVFQKEIGQRKIQLTKLNAIICRLSNAISRADM